MANPLEVRFWRKVDKSAGPDGCWIWTGTKNGNGQGYGVAYVEGRWRPAHRIAWQLANDQIVPAGLQACHHCDNPPCVNPAHIFIGTNADNCADRTAKTLTCRRGHPWDDIRIGRDGQRHCLRCERIRHQAWIGRVSAVRAARREFRAALSAEEPK